MAMVSWLHRSLADVPADDRWLTAGERDVLAGLAFAKRRRDWRLGRFTAKAVVGARLHVEPGRVEVLADATGAPAARVDGSPVPLALSLSHRGDRAIAVVAPTPVGCDLEVVEPRSHAFVGEWLSPSEQELVRDAPADRRDLLANLVWTAKEASAKARGGGLRLNVRQAVVEPELAVVEGDGEWRPLRVAWPEGVDHGAWRSEPGWVMAVVSRGAHPGEVRMDPAAPPHRSTAARRWSHAGAVVDSPEGSPTKEKCA